mgnify:CR=1 FL=1
MNTSSFWRKAAIALILANVLFGLWSGGTFGFMGLDPNPQREPQRLDEQVAPEAVQIGAALANYRGFRQRGFRIVGVYDNDPSKIGKPWGEAIVHDMADLAQDIQREEAPIAVLAIKQSASQAAKDSRAQGGGDLRSLARTATEVHARRLELKAKLA